MSKNSVNPSSAKNKSDTVSKINAAARNAMGNFNKSSQIVTDGIQDANEVVAKHIDQSVQNVVQKANIDEDESAKKLAEIQEMLRKVTDNLYSNSSLKH